MLSRSKIDLSNKIFDIKIKSQTRMNTEKIDKKKRRKKEKNTEQQTDLYTHCSS